MSLSLSGGGLPRSGVVSLRDAPGGEEAFSAIAGCLCADNLKARPTLACENQKTSRYVCTLAKLMTQSYGFWKRYSCKVRI